MLYMSTSAGLDWARAGECLTIFFVARLHIAPTLTHHHACWNILHVPFNLFVVAALCKRNETEWKRQNMDDDDNDEKIIMLNILPQVWLVRLVEKK